MRGVIVYFKIQRCESTEAMRIASDGRVVPDRHAAGRVFEAKRRKPARPSHVPSSHLEPTFSPLAGAERGDEDESGPPQALAVAFVFA